MLSFLLRAEKYSNVLSLNKTKKNNAKIKSGLHIFSGCLVEWKRIYR